MKEKTCQIKLDKDKGKANGLGSVFREVLCFI